MLTPDRLYASAMSKESLVIVERREKFSVDYQFTVRRDLDAIEFVVTIGDRLLSVRKRERRITRERNGKR